MGRSCLALVILACVIAGPVAAQDTTGGVTGVITSQDGVPLPAVEILVEDGDTGLARRTSSNVHGVFHVSALPPGAYTLIAAREGFATYKGAVVAPLGVTARHDIEMQVGAFTDTVEVSGDAPPINTGSSTSGRNLDTGLLDGLLPLAHDTTQLAFLVPGTVPGDSAFQPSNREVRVEQTGCTMCGWGTPGQDLLSFEGASVAENLYVVDGLNVTNFSQGLGSTMVPLSFVEEVQVKNGGLEAEFGRTTGGVVNMVTKSGTNTLRGEAHLWWSPESLQELPPNTLYREHQSESREGLETTASLGGPLVRDKLFFFVFLRHLETDSTEHHRDGTDYEFRGWPPRGYRYQESSPYWGTRLDWNPASGHRLNATYLSDKVEVDKTRYEIDPEIGELSDPVRGWMPRGGHNVMLRYSGVLGDNFMLTAQAARNDFDRNDQSEADECPVAYDPTGREIGCWMLRDIMNWNDRRDSIRLDVDWFVGRHALKAGVDHEHNVSDVALDYSGGALYQYRYNFHNWPELPWDTLLVSIEEGTSEGQVEAATSAAYVQDSWTPTPSLTFNIGLRWDRYRNRNANGATFLPVADTMSPRFGVAWDPTGDGRSKVYASIGRYVLPSHTSAVANWGLNTSGRVRTYVVEGEILPDGTPEALGELLMDRPAWYDGFIADHRIAADTSEPFSQRELILGYQRSLGPRWTVGLRGVARELEETIEDFGIEHALWEVYGVCDPSQCGSVRLGNPGRDFLGWYDLDEDGVYDPIHLSAEALDYPPPKREYCALELSAERRFMDSWMLFAAYTWSHSYGNYEGMVNSDGGPLFSGFNGSFDRPSYMEHATGDLPNDRRHSLKLYGAHTWRNGLQLGGTFFYRTGRAVNSFGYHPTDPHAPFAFYTAGEAAPRGSMGRTEDLWSTGLSLGCSWPWGKAELDARVQVFNLFDNQAEVEVEELGEFYYEPADAIITNSSWGETTAYQSPRSVRFSMGVSF